MTELVGRQLPNLASELGGHVSPKGQRPAQRQVRRLASDGLNGWLTLPDEFGDRLGGLLLPRLARLLRLRQRD
jgi:hypothetical protein